MVFAGFLGGLRKRQGESSRGGSAKIMRVAPWRKIFSLWELGGKSFFPSQVTARPGVGLRPFGEEVGRYSFFPSQRKRLMTKFFKEAMTHGAWRERIWE